MISHVFGLVGEYTSLLLTNQHLEEEPPIVEKELGCLNKVHCSSISCHGYVRKLYVSGMHT